jgi:X-Pro dipeptidyl-peptidase
VLGFGAGKRHQTEAFIDDQNLWEEDWAATVGTSTPAKTSFTTGVLTKPLRLSGSGSIRVAASASTSSAHLSAVLVDLGPQTIRDYAGGHEGITTGTTRTCFGAGTTGDTGCFLDTSAATTTVDHQVFSRGWAALNSSEPVVPGRRYSVSISLASTDHVIPAGHRLALIVAGTDSGLIEPPASTPTVTVDLSRSLARLPVVGGAPAVVAASWVAPTSTGLKAKVLRTRSAAPAVGHFVP